MEKKGAKNLYAMRGIITYLAHFSSNSTFCTLLSSNCVSNSLLLAASPASSLSIEDLRSSISLSHSNFSSSYFEEDIIISNWGIVKKIIRMTRSISNVAMTFLYFLIGAEIKELKSRFFFIHNGR